MWLDQVSIVLFVLVIVPVVLEIRQWPLVQHHPRLPCALVLVHVDALPRPNTSGAWPCPPVDHLPPPRARPRARRHAARYVCVGRLPKRVAVGRYIEHLLATSHAQLAHAPIPRHIPAVPVLEGMLVRLHGHAVWRLTAEVDVAL